MSSHQLPDLDRKVIEYLLSVSGKKKFDEDQIFNKYYKPTVNDEKKKRQAWSKVKHRLGEVLQNFIVFQKMKKNPMREIVLLNFYAENNLHSIKERLIKNKKKRLSKNKDFDTPLYEYLLSEFVLEDQYAIRKPGDLFDAMENKLDDFYLEKKMRCLCERINRSQIINTALEEEPILFDWIEIKIKKAGSIRARLYYLCYKMFKTTTPAADDYFQEVKDLIQEYINVIDDQTSQEIIQYLLNYCTQKVNKNKLSFARDYLVFISLLESQNLLLIQNTISAIKFKNCINIALIADDIKWAKAFCEKYTAAIPEEHRMGVSNLSRANIAFYESDFDSCIKILDQFEFADPYHRLAFDLLWLRIDCVRVQKENFDLHHFLKRVKNRKAYIRKQDWIEINRKEKLLYLLDCLTKIAKGKTQDLEIDKSKLYTLDYLWLKKVLKKEP